MIVINFLEISNFVYRLIILYLTMPETEGRTLEDIETYFGDEQRKFNDIKIPKRLNEDVL